MPMVHIIAPSGSHWWSHATIQFLCFRFKNHCPKILSNNCRKLVTASAQWHCSCWIPSVCRWPEHKSLGSLGGTCRWRSLLKPSGRLDYSARPSVPGSLVVEWLARALTGSLTHNGKSMDVLCTLPIIFYHLLSSLQVPHSTDSSSTMACHVSCFEMGAFSPVQRHLKFSTWDSASGKDCDRRPCKQEDSIRGKQKSFQTWNILKPNTSKVEMWDFYGFLAVQHDCDLHPSHPSHPSHPMRSTQFEASCHHRGQRPHWSPCCVAFYGTTCVVLDLGTSPPKVPKIPKRRKVWFNSEFES